MHRPVLLMLLAASALHVDSFAQQQVPAVKQVLLHARAETSELKCETRPSVARAAAAPDPDPMELPADDMVQALAPAGLSAAEPPVEGAAPLSSVRALASADGYRIAIWGDSHLAAGFFNEELAKLLKLPTDSVSNALVPANMGRGGVRLPIRRSCVSSQWKYEPGYLGGDNAAAPGPGLVNMVSDQPGSTLAWDVRKDAQSPGYERVRLLYQQADAPITIGVGINGDAEKTIVLDQQPGPAILELAGDQAITQVRVRLIDARFRFHGLELLSSQANPYEMDVFGYPGATVASWKSANLDYLGAWFAQRNYQLVMLEFGTNEGNAKPFDLLGYRKLLTDSVRNMRTVFPTSACILIAPGDRGILVRRSVNKGKKRGRKAKPEARIDLLPYARIHAAIGRVQTEVAAAAGCSAWSMQDAMGGPGRAYQWARQSPPLMSRDLIHFTVAGYQRLAQKFAADMGWTGRDR